VGDYQHRNDKGLYSALYKLYKSFAHAQGKRKADRRFAGVDKISGLICSVIYFGDKMLDDVFGIKSKVIEEEESEEKKITIFDYLRDIMSGKKGNIHLKRDPNLKVFSTFQVIRFLSLDDGYIPYVNLINRFQSELTKEQMYKFLVFFLPRTKKFLQFPKKEDNLLDDDSINLIKEYFECSESDAIDYIKLRFICDFHIDTIKKKFGGKI
jgi:hypothetical protein